MFSLLSEPTLSMPFSLPALAGKRAVPVVWEAPAEWVVVEDWYIRTVGEVWDIMESWTSDNPKYMPISVYQCVARMIIRVIEWTSEVGCGPEPRWQAKLELW